MSTESVRPQVYQVVADVMNVPLASVSDDSTPQTIEGWDSVQHLNLVLALEAALGVQLAPEEIEQMQSVGKVVEIVGAKAG